MEKAALESEGYGIMGVGDDIAHAGSWKQGLTPLKDNPLPVSPDAQNYLRMATDKVKTNKGVTGAHNIDHALIDVRNGTITAEQARR
ncbi:MAG: hypothetical protein FWF88_13175 [Peptococcaceae bacterium]|nr:hypothetical protein [Peptococcaceae bacterium]